MLSGHYQRGGHSTQIAAHLQIDTQGRVFCREAALDGVAFSALTVSARIGNTRRYLNFPDGACFETDDNDTVDRWVREHRHVSYRGSMVHRLEANARYVAAAALITLLFTATFLVWGVPWLSKQAAYALPQEVSASLGQGTLEFLDKHLLATSELSADRQRDLAALFAMLAPTNIGFELKLELRSSELIGANAFALPDGTIVLTDDFITLAANDQQIAAVMLHEIGHVSRRHGLRGALQNAGLATLLVAIAGDVSSASSLLVTLPTLLVRTSYSRDMETEADLYAASAMIMRHMDPQQLLHVLHRLEQAHNDSPGGRRRDGGWLDYLSTHPLGEDRFLPLREFIAGLHPA